MQRHLGRSFALVAVVLAACTFGTTSTWVTSVSTPTVGRMAVTWDASRVFVHDYANNELRAYTPGTDVVLASYALTSNGTVRDLAADPNDVDAVVELRKDGYVKTFTYNTTTGNIDLIASIAPRPVVAGTTREYCGVEKASTGDLYVTLVETTSGVKTGVLSKRTSAGVWSTVNLPSATCYQVALDEETTQTQWVILNGGGATFYGYTTGLSPHGWITPSPYMNVADFDIRGREIFAVGQDGGGSTYAAIYGMDGSQQDREFLGTFNVFSAQIDVNDATGSGARGVWSSDGYNVVQTIQLLE